MYGKSCAITTVVEIKFFSIDFVSCFSHLTTSFATTFGNTSAHVSHTCRNVAQQDIEIPKIIDLTMFEIERARRNVETRKEQREQNCLEREWLFIAPSIRIFAPRGRELFVRLIYTLTIS